MLIHKKHNLGMISRVQEFYRADSMPTLNSAPDFIDKWTITPFFKGKTALKWSGEIDELNELHDLQGR